jgi:hypothetical protein
MSHRPGTDDRSAKADSEEQQHAVKRSFREIMREISPAALRETAIQGEMDLLDELETRLAQIRRKSHVAWYRSPSYWSPTARRCSSTEQRWSSKETG